MKRWAILVAGVYALALIFLAGPLVVVSFKNTGGGDVLDFYRSWGLWVWIALMVAGQVVLLLHIDRSGKRLPARRPLKGPIIVTAGCFALLLFFGLHALASGIWGDDSFAYGEWLEKIGLEGDWVGIVLWLGLILVFWVFWAVVFWRVVKLPADEDSAMRLLLRGLLAGSVLELLVAIPSHIATRQRDDCCAPIPTFMGIATGISVMLMAFGPGVLLLYADRIKRKRGGS